jgi:hypothetical protein
MDSFAKEADMRRIYPWLAFPAVLWATTLHAQQANDPKKNDEPMEAEVRFTDDSLVRMIILQERLEILTKYGKLTIPVADIMKIDFGVHVPPDLEKKIGRAIDDLGSDNYKTRTMALKELVGVGPYAYPQIYRATKAEEPEVIKRANMALDKIRAKHPARNLRLREEDIVTTPTFTIVGRIVTPTLKAKSENFGELGLKLAKLRTMRLLNSSHETEVVVDAVRYGSAVNQWMDSGWEARSGVRLVIAASGTVNLWPQGGGYTCSPKGYGAVGPSPPGTQFQAGALLGRIGEDGPAFLIGEHFDSNLSRDGRLYLHIVPSPWQNASIGTYQVKITPRGELASGN